MMRVCGFNLIIFFVSISISSANLPLGTRCRLKNRSTGICVKIAECQSIQDQINSGTIKLNPPTICSQTQRTVCCPIQATVVKEAIATPSTTQAPTRISERKCKEYAVNVVKEVKVASLLIGEEQSSITIDKCKRKSVPLIVGGSEADLHEFPHQALLGYNDGNPDEWGCGGSLISPKFILTAAHCLYPRSFGAVKFVKLGMNYRNEQSGKIYIFGVDKIFQHPNYSARNFIEDIGLLRLNGSVTFSEFILPICLPTKQHDSGRAVVSGFGRTGYGQSSSEKLLKVTLEKFTADECQQAFGKAINVDNGTMLCYGHHTENKDSCSGDSGGPLQISNEENVRCTYTQVGIVSFGLRQCGTIGKPGVYVNVFHYLNWIEEIVWKDEN